MVVRELDLKLILRRGKDGAGLRQKIWLTNATVNQTVAKIKCLLLLSIPKGGYQTDQGPLVLSWSGLRLWRSLTRFRNAPPKRARAATMKSWMHGANFASPSFG